MNCAPTDDTFPTSSLRLNRGKHNTNYKNLTCCFVKKKQVTQSLPMIAHSMGARISGPSATVRRRTQCRVHCLCARYVFFSRVCVCFMSLSHTGQHIMRARTHTHTHWPIQVTSKTRKFWLPTSARSTRHRESRAHRQKAV